MTQPTIRGANEAPKAVWCLTHRSVDGRYPCGTATDPCRLTELITLTDAEAMRGRCAECSKAIVDAQSLITLSAAEAMVKAERERCAALVEGGLPVDKHEWGNDEAYWSEVAARIREGRQ